MMVGVKFKGRLFRETASLSPGMRSIGFLPDWTIIDLKCLLCHLGMFAKSSAWFDVSPKERTDV